MNVTTVSFSSDKKLVRCEMQYSYRYDQRLKPKVKAEGLFRGSWIHDLLYAHRKKQDWKKKFEEIKEKKWDGLFDEQKELYGENFPDHIYNLFDHYAEHWKNEDKSWKIVHLEEMFEIKTRFGFPIKWKSDCITKIGRELVLVENKNKKKIPEADERILAPQAHGYCFLFEQLGIHIDRILWDYIRTEPVPRPEKLKDGSLSRRKINTDQRTYLAAMQEYGIKFTPKMQTFMDDLPETLALLRVSNTPNLRVGEMYIRDWIDRARRAQNIKRPTRNFTRSCKWECDYFGLCQIDMIGKVDRNLEISKNFVRVGDIKHAN